MYFFYESISKITLLICLEIMVINPLISILNYAIMTVENAKPPNKQISICSMMSITQAYICFKI